MLLKALGTENTHSSIPGVSFKNCLKKCTSIVIDFLVVFPDEKLMQNSVFIMKMMPKRTTKL
ncbi:hypothetical protein FPW19_03605 [Escherichia coli]|nr:hypothetical protein [Escherichia coli]EHU22304.1 hypothetical protein ECDEC1D_2968 [Escherichia coli DEC1D]EHU28209.1 hypothetical protein ECDEC2A_2752 [Escherichia coli DEC2A]